MLPATPRFGATTVAALAMVLSATVLAQESQKGNDDEALICASRTTNFYLFPSAPKTYECCNAAEPVVVAGAAGAAGAPDPQSVVTPNAGSARVVASAPPANCVDVATLTPIERAIRASTVASCVRFVVYDHFPCQCFTGCAPGQCGVWTCDCPNVAPGELPEIKPQDSLGSQPELIGSICTPCSRLSTCQSG